MTLLSSRGHYLRTHRLSSRTHRTNTASFPGGSLPREGTETRSIQKKETLSSINTHRPSCSAICSWGTRKTLLSLKARTNSQSQTDASNWQTYCLARQTGFSYWSNKTLELNDNCLMTESVDSAVCLQICTCVACGWGGLPLYPAVLPPLALRDCQADRPYRGCRHLHAHRDHPTAKVRDEEDTCIKL